VYKYGDPETYDDTGDYEILETATGYNYECWDLCDKRNAELES